ncbi:MAG: hypothetical protein II547_00890 [Treponema sp.]|nr:hypothetical protein [Treponema sp.]
MEYSGNLHAGRKTFFVAPDLTLLPEMYMEEYMTHGYESYIINDDRYCPIDRKVELIISMFPSSIFFFYVDAKIEGLEWRKFIYGLQREHGNEALFGVLYSKSKSEEERKQLENFYLFDVGIQCGCVGLDFQHKKNFPLIDNILKANQAAGRRKAIRAICSGASEVSFVRDNKQYRGKISDISLNHFSCTLYDGSLPLYSKIKDMMLVIDGVHIQTNGVLLMQRKIGEDEVLNVFIFSTSDGSMGLEGENFIRVSEKIYQIISTKTKDVLHRLFITAGKELEESLAAEKLKKQAIQSAKDKAEKLAKAEQQNEPESKENS